MEQKSKIVSRRFLVLASVLVAFVLLLFAEVGLRIGGFRFDTTPRYMQFNYPNPKELYEIFVPDSDTLWRLKPGTKMIPETEPINSKGFRGPEFSIEKSAGVKRVTTLGDSVTFGDVVNYPRVMEKCLGDGWEVINAGVPGYSLYQGARQFETSIASLKPDVVTVMFGWNDHWFSRGFPDSGQRVNAPEDGPWLFAFFKNLRLYHMLHYSLTGGMKSELPDSSLTYRVPVNEYRVIIDKLVDDIKNNGAKPVLITAPSALDQGKFPMYLFDIGFVSRIEGKGEAEFAMRLKKLHAEYNDVVREVAKEKNVILLDLETQWYIQGTAALFRDPTKDVIHPNEEGYRLMGKTLCDKVEAIGSRP